MEDFNDVVDRLQIFRPLPSGFDRSVHHNDTSEFGLLNELHQFRSRFWSVEEHASHGRRSHNGLLFSNASALHATVGSFDDDGRTERLQFSFEVVCDAFRDSLLILQAASVKFQYPCQFADADDPLNGDVSDVGSSPKRLEMMFTG